MGRFADCEALFAALSEYLDAELPGEDCAEFRRHLEGCPECIEFLNSLERTIALCRQQPGSAAELPPPLSAAARQELWEAFQKSQVRQAHSS